MRYLILLKQSGKCKEISKITDMLAIADVYRHIEKTDIYNADIDTIPIISISAIFRYIDPALVRQSHVRTWLLVRK